MCECPGIGQIIDGNDIDLRKILGQPEHTPANSAKAIYPYVDH
jgi:hypothetical protein